jgi:AcrR family transcriptional regulator
MTNNDFTAKGQQTRQHLIATAIRLFTAQGYETVTMRDIADAAECSPGLTYRYFAHKEELVIALYEQLAEETLAYAHTLPFGTLADRYHALMQHKMAQVKPHRAALAAMFGAVMRPDVEVSVWGNRPLEGRDHMLEAFTLIVKDASDKPQEPLASSMGMLFYCFHLLLLLFWLYDRTPEAQATMKLLTFMQEALKLVRPMLLMPLIAKAMMKLAAILAQVFGSVGVLPAKNSDHPPEA